MEMEPGKLFVGGISWDTNEDRLKEYFQAFGDVIEAVIMKDRITGRARGFGFVVFADPSVAERVVKEKHIIDGRTVEAKKAVPRDDQHITRNNGSMQGSPGPARTKKIFVGGLASSVTESDFKNYFDQFGTITDVVVMYDHNTQRPRGFGFITFDSEEAVDKVLYKAFHELNGKMVEVKRAVPKELSPSPARSPFNGQNYGLNRVNNLLNAYTQGYVPSSIGNYGMRMEGRYSPLTAGRNGYSSFNPADFNLPSGMDSTLNLNYGGNGNFGSNYGRGFNSLYNGNSNRFNGPVGFAPGRVGSSSMLNSVGWNLWDNESLNYGTNSANSTDFVGSGSGAAGYGTLGGLGTIWGSSSISGQGGGNGSFGTGNIANSGEAVGTGYGRNSGSNAVNTSPYSSAKDIPAGAFGNLYGNTVGASFYEDSAWRSTSPELDDSASFGYGLGNAESLGYVGGYSVANRSNKGIAA
ncbi:heterogeneous nuclear ribonucleoprotein 1 [Solanum lycopersicum]|uniref:RRM domain-containing protein n=1 Tax=Solanum lycopersicum TaxID=4081 RepID=A0A3Q7IT23_SOLLC|nr:heterogeneous nuclear ribonucleoprotein 1 [Solanum lycopersicum]